MMCASRARLRRSVTGEVVCGYRLLRELGARALPTYAAVDPKPRKGGDALCIVEQLAREPGVSAEAAAEFLRDAKRLSHLHHPNVVRVRDVVVGTNTVLLVSDWIEGEALSEVERAAGEADVAVPLAASLRVLVDLLEGLSALHELRDAKREPMKLVHAEVAPRNLVLGLDGRAVLAHPLRAPNGTTKKLSPHVVGYLAPEVLLGDQTADQRADVFGAGVILWEALMGQRMHAEGEDVGEIVMRLLGGKIEAACAPADAPWAVPLAEVAKKATAPDPSVRFANATAMLAEVRRAIGPRLAGKSVVATIVETAVGDHVRARARALLPSDPDATQPPPVSSSRGDTPPVSVPIDHPPLADATPPASAEVAFAPFSTEAVTATSSNRIAAAPPSSSSRASAPPTSADVVEVIELEVPQDRPSRPRAPPPFRPREKPVDAEHAKKAEHAADFTYAPVPAPTRPTSQSKTDLASLALVSTPTAAASGGGTARAKWTIVAACAIGVAAAAWMILRGGAERTETTEAPAPSSMVSTTEAPVAPPASAIAVAPAASASASPPLPANATGPFDPQVADDHAPLPARSPHSATPQPATPTPKDATPFPVAPSAAAKPEAPAPASSSPHPKKRVYDPMGI
jgi:serine/threonine protein kinase